jgi:hypothetical protein
VSHPFVERLIGTIRREYLDRTFFWNTLDLERKLDTFLQYYNHARVHQSLDGNAPGEVSGIHQSHAAQLSNYSWMKPEWSIITASRTAGAAGDCSI